MSCASCAESRKYSKRLLETIVTKTEYARMRGRDASRVSRWIAEGKITPAALVGEGIRARIWVEQADADLDRNLDLGQQLAQPVSTIAPSEAIADRIADERRAERSHSAAVRAAGGRVRPRGVDEEQVARKREIYAAEKAKSVQLDNERKQIAIDKERRNLLPLGEVTDAMARCAEVMVREIDRLPDRADDLVTAMSRGGVAEVRNSLKSVARDMREQLARSMRLIEAEGAAAEDLDGEDGA